jgi:hypothetical protein
MALMHGISQHVQLLEHSMVCDVPSCGLVDDDLCTKKDPAETVLQILWLKLGAFADEKI